MGRSRIRFGARRALFLVGVLASALILALGALFAHATEASASPGGAACTAVGAASGAAGLACNAARAATAAASGGGSSEASSSQSSNQSSGESSEEEGGSSASGDSGESSSSDTSSSGASEEEGPLTGAAVDAGFGLLSAIWDRSGGDLGEKITEDLGEALLFTPDPTEDDAAALASIYEEVQKLMAPALLIGILIIALLKIVASYNVGAPNTSLSKLGPIMGVALSLGAMPFLFSTLSTLAMDITGELLPEGEDMAGSASGVLAPLTGLFAVTGIVTLILAVFALWVAGKVLIISLIKLVVWPLLFLCSPAVLALSLLPGCSHFAENWAKMVGVLAFLPAAWALELWLGAKLMAAPEAIFGSVATSFSSVLTPGLLSSAIAIGVLWVISHTPSKMMALAFQSYRPGFSTGLRTAGNWVARAVVMQGTKAAMGAITGGAGGAAAGAGSSAGAAGGESYSFSESMNQRQQFDPQSGGWESTGPMTWDVSYRHNSGPMSAEEMAQHLQGKMAETGETHAATDQSRSAGGWPQPPRQEPGHLPASHLLDEGDSGWRRGGLRDNDRSRRGEE